MLDCINPNGKMPGSNRENYKRNQIVYGVLKPTQLLSSNLIPAFPPLPRKGSPNIGSTLVIPNHSIPFCLRTHALFTNGAVRGKDVSFPWKPADADPGRRAGRQREASQFPIHFLLLEQPKAPSQEIRHGGHTASSSSCPAAPIINAPRTWRGAELPSCSMAQTGKNSFS